MRVPLNYQQIIETARSKLDDGEKRIADAPYPFRATWWPGVPTFEQELLSDYGVRTCIPELENAFYAEVNAIRESLTELGHTPKLADWQKGSKGPARERMTSLNTTADALETWDHIGLPVRRRVETVFRLLAPRDVFGSPSIQGLHIDDYIRGVCTKTAEDVAHIARLEKRLNAWRSVSILLGVVVALVGLWLLSQALA